MSLAACVPVSTGNGFLKGTLAYLGCAGEAIGSAGYAALSHPGSVVFQLVLAAVTLFIAWQGLLMMFGRTPTMGDAVVAAAKIGLVLMLVTSWPAVRTLFAEPSSRGPGELVAAAGMGSSSSLEERLQRADDGIVVLTKWGTGKLDIRAGQTADGRPAATEFAGIGLADNLALGLGRLAFLVGSLLSLGLVKLLGGVMVSALPVFASLLLFEALRGVFLGCLRLMFALFLAGFAVPVILRVELSLLEPWLKAAIEQRIAFHATPSAPTELLAITASFLLILTGSIALLVRSCFASDLPGLALGLARKLGFVDQEEPQLRRQPATGAAAPAPAAEMSRAHALAGWLNRGHRPAPATTLEGRFVFDTSAGPDSRSGLFERRPGLERRRARQRAALSQTRRNRP